MDPSHTSIHRIRIGQLPIQSQNSGIFDIPRSGRPRMTKSVHVLAGLCLFRILVSTQETRGTINGRVYDKQTGAMVGANVTITNSDTGAVTRFTTNETGYYE